MEASSIPAWAALLVFLIPLFTIIFEGIKFFITRRDKAVADSKKDEEPTVELVEGDTFSMDREIVTMLRSEIEAKTAEIKSLHQTVRTLRDTLLRNDIEPPV